MKTLLFLLFLIIFHCGHAVVILQSTTATTVVSPTGQTTIYSSYYNTKQTYFIGPGSQWITSSKVNSKTRFQNLFYATCVGNANLTITAASNFSAYLDGVFIGSGKNNSVKYVFPIKIACGRHNFTVIVYRSGNANVGLTFSINQDQSKCFKCQITGYWSESSCSCQCIANPCVCTAPKVWKTYPVCGCGCPLIRYLAEDAKAAAESEKAAESTKAAAEKVAAADSTKAAAEKVSAAESAKVADNIKAEAAAQILPLCLYPKYYNSQTCGCTCHYAYCPYGQYYDQVGCRCYTIVK